MELLPNKGKNLTIEVEGKKYARYPVKTKLITPKDTDISPIIAEFCRKHLVFGDTVFISEKAVAITQGRSYPIGKIKASWLAGFLSRFVTKTPIGIGLGSPQTMQLAIDEAGAVKILIAALVGFLGKIMGISGWFYIIAGQAVRSIDGAVPYALPPYNTYVSKGPKNAGEVARAISQNIGAPVAIVDANDIGVNILGSSPGVDGNLIAKIIKDNPLGQSDEQTPVGIIREILPDIKREASDGPVLNNMILRQAELKDKGEIIAIASEIYLDIPYFVWNEDDFVTRQIQNQEYFVVEFDGKLAGIMSLRKRGNKVSIETLAVKKEFRSRGFGGKLIEFAKQFTKEKGCALLHVYSFSEYRIADFYVKKGFKILNSNGYYKNYRYDCFELTL